MNAAAASTSARSIWVVAMPSKIVRSASPTSASTETSGARSPTRRGDRGHEPRRVERHRGAVAGADGEAAEAGALDRRRALRVALALPIGAVEDVGLGDFVEALAHERLLDQVLDVLDGRRRFAEAGIGLGDDAVDDGMDARRLDGRTRGADRLRHRAVDPAAVEGDDVAGAFDDAQNGHGRSPWMDLDLPTYGHRQGAVNYILWTTPESFPWRRW